MTVDTRQATFYTPFRSREHAHWIGGAVVSIPACHAGGRGFKSRPIRQKVPAVQYRLYGWNCAKVAQSVEHTTENRSVGSSILPFGTKKRTRYSRVLFDFSRLT